MTTNTTIPPLWQWCVFPAVTMSLGWGLRGYIGGGPLGAMIPGAMVGLALCLLLHTESRAALVAAFAAVGIGFGGQETYGQTVYISTIAETWGWGITGFTIKGAAWGLLGGAAIGIAFARERFKRVQIMAGLALMVVGTYIGWKAVNQPKLVYFSNPHDRPREELWAGLLLGGLFLLGWLGAQGGARLPWRFALWGALGGGAGFGLGAAIHVWGRAHAPGFAFEWWKTMEFIFGALLGLAYGYCAWRHRDEIAPQQEDQEERLALPAAVLFAAAGIAVAVYASERFPVRFEYSLTGAALLAAALFSRNFCWQTAITVTVCAFAFDFLENRGDLPAAGLRAFLAAVALATLAHTVRRPFMRPQFLYLTLSAVAVALLKGLLLPKAAPQLQLVVTEMTFVALAVLAILFMPRATSESQRAARFLRT